MCRASINNINILRLLIPALLIFLFPVQVLTQNDHPRDTVIKISGGSVLRLNNKRLFVKNDTSIVLSGSMVNAAAGNERTIAFYDSLKAKAGKNPITRALYDLVIITPDSSGYRKFSRRSDEDFSGYSGLKIRNITIDQVGVFGGNINNPAAFSPNRLEKFLNSTHISTNEKIIKRYLLFTTGDTISTLRITDNERILRQLPYIDDARIIIVPVSDKEADVIVITKDIYSLGGDFTYRGKGKGSVWLYDKNIFGMGHELKLEIPYSSTTKDSPGLGLNYLVNNIGRSFINLDVSYYNGLGKNTYGFSLNRKLLSSETKYAFGINLNMTSTTVDLDTLPVPEPLHYSFQDYWFIRSFLIDRNSVSRIIAGMRYINNNVWEKPDIQPNTYYSLQRYRLYLASVSFSVQKYYKTNLIYSYGRTEDIPYGALFRATSGIEDNEFKLRMYLGGDISYGRSINSIGYFRLSAGTGTFLNDIKTEQGIFFYGFNYFSNLVPLGKQMIRNFVRISYTCGYNRNRDEYLQILKNDAFSSFSNDSLKGTRRFNLGVETVIFNPVNYYGFRFAFFGFADMSTMGGTSLTSSGSVLLTGIGAGIRIRNDNLVFRTFQVRLGYFPVIPIYSKTNAITVSGEQLLRPENFDPGPPGLFPYR